MSMFGLLSEHHWRQIGQGVSGCGTFYRIGFSFGWLGWQSDVAVHVVLFLGEHVSSRESVFHVTDFSHRVASAASIRVPGSGWRGRRAALALASLSAALLLRQQLRMGHPPSPRRRRRPRQRSLLMEVPLSALCSPSEADSNGASHQVASAIHRGCIADTCTRPAK